MVVIYTGGRGRPPLRHRRGLEMESSHQNLHIYKRKYLCYTVCATQLNEAIYRGSVFPYGKNTCSCFAFSCGLSKVVSQQSELCVFRCVASAAHLFIFGGSRNEKNTCHFVIRSADSGVCASERSFRSGKNRLRHHRRLHMDADRRPSDHFGRGSNGKLFVCVIQTSSVENGNHHFGNH